MIDNNLLKELNDKGIKLTCENGKLKYFGPEHQITPELLKKLKDNKESLIKYLCSEEKPDSITSDFNDFEQLYIYLQRNGYKFSIKNAKLTYDSPNQGQNEKLDNAIAKHYRHLYQLYWPMPNANLTPIQPEGAGDPFFIVHGEQSTPFIQDTFGTEVPLFDYFHQSSDGSRMKYRTVEEVAEFYLQQLLSIKSEGNFLLGGYSFGGLVAYEMAQRLIKMGKTVKLLVIIDTCTPHFNEYVYTFHSFKDRLKFYLVNPVREKAWSIIRKIRCNYSLKMGKPVPAHLRSFYIVDNYMKHSIYYKPQPFNGRLHLITANHIQTRDPYLGWGKFIKGGIELDHLPGNHRELVRNPESAKILAKKIFDFIRKV
jgi:thioesterase domain-containing protein